MEAPHRREAAVELAQYYYTQQNWKECLDWAKLALLVKEKPLDYLCEEFAWGDLPYDLAAISSYNLELYKEAAEYGALAQAANPSDQRLKDNLGYYLKALESKLS
jgi:hypothetical protein